MNRNLLLVILALVLASLLLPGCAQLESHSSLQTGSRPTSQPQSEWQKLHARYQASGLPEQERAAAFQPAFRAFALEAKGTDDALSALLALLDWTRFQTDPEQRDEHAARLAQEILENHEKSPRLTELAELSGRCDATDHQFVLNRLLHVSPHDVVKATAQLRLALVQKDINDLDASEESRQGFQQLVEHYEDIPYRYTTFGALGEAYLEPHPEDLLVPGEEAPELVGGDAKGQPLSLAAHRGKSVVLIIFWGDWSEECRKLYPELSSLTHQLRDKHFALLGVNSDRHPMRLIELDVPGTSIFDGGLPGGPVAALWNVRDWPTTYVVDHKGIIRGKQLTGAKLKSKIEECLKKIAE